MENEKNTAQEILQEELAAIYIGNLNTVDEDLILPEQGKKGGHFTWESGEERFIEPNGKVHRPLHGMGSRKVILTVTGEYQGCTAQRRFEANVLQQEKTMDITGVRPVKIRLACGCPVCLPSVAIVTCADGRRTTRPAEWSELVKNGAYSRAEGRVEGTELPVEAEIFWEDSVSGETSAPEKKLEYIAMNGVRLAEGTPYAEAQERMVKFLLAQDDDQMLYNFRTAAGLSTQGAEPMTGWDADECKLKGHTTGHYLSGLALAYAATGDERILEKINYMVSELRICQKAFEGKEGYRPGFLSAYSEEQFDLLEQYTKYPEIWAPYYTLDKIMSGLYDCLTLASCHLAGEILFPKADWVYDRLSRLDQSVLNKMWSMYIAGEYGGMYGIMIKIYALTKKPEHLKAARLFLNEKLFYPMEENCDTLEDMHANQHIPQIIGAMDDFIVNGREQDWKISSNFWNIVTSGHTYCIGGVGETEMFHRAGTTCDYLTDKAAESCASYNMIRLTGQIFPYTVDGAMMDYYENTLSNHILASASQTEDGGTTYFMPLGPGGKRFYDTDENTCCHGTGMESRIRYQGNIYAADEKYLYVNLWIASQLFSGEKVSIRTEEEGCLKLTARENMAKAPAIRIPGWAEGKVTVLVNGEETKDFTIQNGYLYFARPLKRKETLEVRTVPELRVLATPDEKFVNLAYGSHILAALSDQQEWITLPALDAFRQTGSSHFEANGIRYVPLPEADLQACHVYFHKK